MNRIYNSDIYYREFFILYVVGPDESEFTRGDFDEGVRELFFSDETIEG